ncbi:MAG: DUF3151 family protein [Acidimicrobiia bacterium]
MTDVHLTPKPPESILSEEPPAIAEAISDAAGERAALEAIAATYPRSMQVWAALATTAPTTIERYAFARVGYHRGLDRLRAEGWRGVGYVRYEHPSNRGFLDCLRQLQTASDEIGETDEAQRCADFLRQLDPEHRQ